MEYDFQSIEQQWKKYWTEKQIYKVTQDSNKPKYYILDMFPYPSGAGLHVGHPLGYIASDIYARYKKLKGFNVLHPMGFDAFGLPAEQYAIETGQHPAVTTSQNIARYRDQLDKLGLSYDWSREIRTSDPKYYKWTQWIFTQLFHSWYDREQQKARPIKELIEIFNSEGDIGVPCPEGDQTNFTAADWQKMNLAEQRAILMKYRLAYLSHAEVWWCEGLGTVLANDEVINGVSERGGFPVVKKRMNQWFLRITEYADRLLEGLDTLDWTDAMKDMQRNWIGKSNGAQVKFAIADDANSRHIEVFTTRPDTIFGVDFMVLAPEHELVPEITTAEQEAAVNQYINYAKSRSERERMSEVKQISGCFTGAYAVHPFTCKKIPVWISEYVLAGYGTGAIMAVPAGDDRDHAFAKHFNIPITNIFGERYDGMTAYSEKAGRLENSEFLNNMEIVEAAELAIKAIEEKGIGTRKVNFKLRDAGFSRQRYWGEPFPIIYQDNIPFTIDEPELNIPDSMQTLPVTLPQVDKYEPGPEGQGPLANITDWLVTPAGNRETNTMPGYAGSSWYFLRYMDPENDTEFAGRAATDYWQQVDLYVGGTEHAVGHLLYSRMWTKVLHDLGYISFDEPFKKLVNQGMIQGSSRFAFRFKNNRNLFVSLNQRAAFLESMKLPSDKQAIEANFERIHVDVSLVNGVEMDTNRFKQWKPELAKAEFVLEPNGQFICAAETEKMSKSKYNVVNPDDIVSEYGADTFRMYEMFLGPIDVSKPWDTNGIEGVHRFLKKLWRLFVDPQGNWLVTDEKANAEELRCIHKTIKKVNEDIEKFAFNTAVSQFMICVNELTSLKTHKKEALEPLIILISPFAPHLAEELWNRCGHSESVFNAAYPVHNEEYLKEANIRYPVAINGKTRVDIELPAEADQAFAENVILQDPTVQKWLEGKAPKKIIYVKGRMINIVC